MPFDPLGALAPHNYFPDAWYASWTVVAGREPVRLIVIAGGRWLYNGDKYVTDIDLHAVPRKHWRNDLRQTIGSLDSLDGTSHFPWGDRLCDIGPEYEPHRLTRVLHQGVADRTVSGAGLTCDGIAIKDGAGDPALRLNPSAGAAGVKITSLEQHVGRHGPYGRFSVALDGGT